MAVTAPDPDTPDPLRETPPADQFCDLVLNGGVASGVVYPWALLRLARHYRFRSIGGNSVGAMAASLAAAAEYGRCHGVDGAFEPLRRMPQRLAEEEGGKTKLLRLFQPSPQVRRLFQLFLIATQMADDKEHRTLPTGWLIVFSLYGLWLPLATLLLLAILAIAHFRPAGPLLLMLAVESVVLVLAATLLIGVLRFWRDLRAMAGNHYGLCTGKGQGGEEGLVDWLHRGIQLSAGREQHDPPLTFADLWSAPRFGESGPAPLAGGVEPRDPGINLQMFSSNVSLGRPVRLPINVADTRLYYDPAEWEPYFPRAVLEALIAVSAPYQPKSQSDPDPAFATEAQRELMGKLRELPSGGMPIVVAARMSLCFPVLFSCVPAYAIDYEAPSRDPTKPPSEPEGLEKRELRRCLLSDGGLCTNFPIHLFDAAHPRWPTFALLLDRRLSQFEDQTLWRPITHLEGRADNWQRGVPGAEATGKGNRPLAFRLLGLAGGIVLTMKDWNDRMTGRLPQVRNRIVRLALKEGEGQLNLAMPGERILTMAREYGNKAGKQLVEQFAPGDDGIKPAWREHLYVRSLVELRALRRHLRGYTQAVGAQGSTAPLRALLDEATRNAPLSERPNKPDPTAARLTLSQRDALIRAIGAVQALESELGACEAQFGPYQPQPEPELRLRPPV